MNRFIWITKGHHSKQVPETAVQKYIDNGWRVPDEYENFFKKK